MGCGASKDDAPAAAPSRTSASSPYESAIPARKSDDPQELNVSAAIDRDLDRARQQEELKVKLLLLGAGESGKSTIFKQMRILHGAPRSEDDLRMYGVVVRSNVITAMRKLCSHLRSLGLEDQLSQDPKLEDDDYSSGMTPKEAYDLLIAHLVDYTANPNDLETPNGDVKDWVGTSARAGLGANNDAKQFLQLWRPIRTLWEVRNKQTSQQQKARSPMGPCCFRTVLVGCCWIRQ
jgi:hypothetical protein